MKDFIIKSDSTQSSKITQKQTMRPAVAIAAKTFQAPTQEAIAMRAYDIYENGGRQQGQCHRNWQQAEKELCM